MAVLTRSLTCVCLSLSPLVSLLLCLCLSASLLSLFPDKMLNSNNMRIVLESDPRKRPMGSQDGGILSKKPWFDK